MLSIILLKKYWKLQPENIQNFLLRTSILNSFSADLCDYLLDSKQSQKTIVELEKTNIFLIPLDSKRKWYRYHHLFADILRILLSQKYADEINCLHRKASEWFESKGRMEDSIGHLLEAKYYKLAEEKIEQIAEELWNSGEYPNLSRWFQSLPSDLIHSNIQLCTYYAWSLAIKGKIRLSEESLNKAFELLNISFDKYCGCNDLRVENLPAKTDFESLGKLIAIRVYINTLRGNIDEVLCESKLANQYIPEKQAGWRGLIAIYAGDAYLMQGMMVDAETAYKDVIDTSRGNKNFHLYAVSNFRLVTLYLFLGEYSSSEDICNKLLKELDDKNLSYSSMAGWFYSILSIIYVEQNRIDEAVLHIQKGTELYQNSDDLSVGMTYLSQLRLYIIKNDVKQLQEMFKRISTLREKMELPFWIVKQFEFGN